MPRLGVLGRGLHRMRTLHRYMAEFDFRYTNRAGVGVDDSNRAVKALLGVVGKRLTYRRTGVA